MSITKPLQINSEFVKEISEIMLQLTGVQFFDKQSGMIQSRLFKRMLELDIKEPEAYLKYLKENYVTESKILVSLLTTHHTFFFREYFHFEFLLKEGLPKIIAEVRRQDLKKIRIWSAACSQGQEVYSLAMFLDYHLAKMAPDIGYEILGTDIDIDCIKVAKNGVYRFEQIKEIPTIYQGNNWQKGCDEISNFVRVKDHLRTNCQFVTSNLFDMSLLMGQTFHLIFCRNVFIYFNQAQINSVSKNLFHLLSPHGYLFLGLSEALPANSLAAEQMGASIYRKPAKKMEIFPQKEEETVPPETKNVLTSQKKKRVVCVDDSPVIIALLKKIFSEENSEFEVVGTAANGIEAREVIQNTKPDIVTLDIHMPQLNGVEYLRQFYSDTHPPVVMISSVSREEAEYGLESLELGAIDFIEKPSISTLQEKSFEILAKLKCALEFNSSNRKETHLQLVKTFKTDSYAIDTSGLVRFCVGGLGDLQKIKTMVRELGASFSPFVIVLHGADSFIPLLIQKMKTESLPVASLMEQDSLKSNQVYLASAEQFDKIKKMISSNNTCHLFVLGDTPAHVVNHICRMGEARILLEESLSLQSKSTYQMIRRVAAEVVPYTSMIYHSARSLASSIKKVA